VRSQSTQFIVHASSQLGRGPPKRGHFSAILAGYPDGLADETHGHINSAGREGMATTVTAAKHSIWRHLYDSTHGAQKPKSKLKFVTLDKESNMSTLW